MAPQRNARIGHRVIGAVAAVAEVVAESESISATLTSSADCLKRTSRLASE